MTATQEEHKTAITVVIEADRQKQESFALEDVLVRCRISSATYCGKSRGPFADLWRGDNHEAVVFEPKRKGRRKRPNPRFHREHVEYMVAAINGIISEQEAMDLWNMRKQQIKNELNARALIPAFEKKKSKTKTN